MCQDVFNPDDEAHSVEAVTESDPSQLFSLLSAAAQSGTSSHKTMQFKCSIQGQSILILVDSGSSHSFIRSSMAQGHPELHPLCSPIKVHVADGGSLDCTHEIPLAVWAVHGYEFHSTLKVLPLANFDMILGMDWLDAFSPMKMHWAHKWMLIPYGTEQILLHGHAKDAVACSVVQLYHISSDSHSSNDSALLPEIQALVEEFASVFAEPSGLPHRRSCDHSIPLV